MESRIYNKKPVKQILLIRVTFVAVFKQIGLHEA
jgi:hypothetical protein